MLYSGFIVISVRVKYGLRYCAQIFLFRRERIQRVGFAPAAFEGGGEVSRHFVAHGEFYGLVFRRIAVGSYMYPHHLFRNVFRFGAAGYKHGFKSVARGERCRRRNDEEDDDCRQCGSAQIQCSHGMSIDSFPVPHT